MSTPYLRVGWAMNKNLAGQQHSMQHERKGASRTGRCRRFLRERDKPFHKKSDQKLILNHSSKSQSAMEYLMTYGWAILIIAIVLIALFQLGILGGSNIPRVQAGACEVLHTSAGSNNEGECQGVWPKYVAQFNGQNSYITASLTNAPLGNSPVTISGWVLHENIASGCRSDFGYGTIPGNFFYVGSVYPENLDLYNHGAGPVNSNLQIGNNVWVFEAATYNGAYGAVYLNNQVYNIPDTQIYTSAPSTLFIGYPVYAGCYLNGFASNIQIYNTSLSQSQIQSLYQEGIGGAPVDPNHIVGWWPLNGNAQDYSGNNNNGQATAVSYTSQWTSGYTQP